jgi:predicted ATPase
VRSCSVTTGRPTPSARPRRSFATAADVDDRHTGWQDLPADRMVSVVRLTRVEIQAYRSLYNVELVPRAFTALVGPNNAGKTNLTDALEFLGQVARNGLEVAVSREGGFENLAFRRSRRTRKPVRFAIEATVRGDEASNRMPPQRDRDLREYAIDVSYSFELRASSESRDADFRVTEETLALIIAGPRQTGVVNLRRREGAVSVATALHPADKPTSSPLGADSLPDPLDVFMDPFSVEQFQEYLGVSLQPTALVLHRAALLNVVIAALLTELGRTRLFQLTPVECRRPGSMTPNPELERHGGNLPAVVHYMRRNHPEASNATLDAMRGIMPGLTRIDTEFTTDRRLALLFHETGARPWTSGEVSDGTIQSLALFTCLFDPRVPVVLIEEPENALHPWIVRMFVDACRQAKGKQVLVTSHSPALVSHLKPDELDIVWRDGDGRTQLRTLAKLDPDAPALWAKGQLDLYELIDGGWVREAVPPGLQ